jgi:hypothetical protein
MSEIIDFVAVRRTRPILRCQPPPLPHSVSEREAISAACLIASQAFQQSTTCTGAEAKRILADAAQSIVAMGNQYRLNEIRDLAISLRMRSDKIRLPRRKLKKITDIFDHSCG